MPQTVKKEEFDELKGEVDHMKENIELLSNPEVLEELGKAKKRIEKGDFVTLEDAEKELKASYLLRQN